jgi:inner membrane protein
VDPVTHTLVGASLSATGLRRATPLATATLVLAANAPDVDIVAQLWDPWTALAWRRGISHGVPALLVLPFLVAGGILAWDRWIRRRGGRGRAASPSLAPARPAPVLGLAALGVWTHSPLDWINNYGMRWLLPFDGRWTYGDAVFILDPWLWLLLGGSLFALHSRGRLAVGLWILLGSAMTLLVLLAPGVPALARGLWILGLTGWIALRLLRPPDPEGPRGRRIARNALAAATVYILLMVGQNGLQQRAVLAAAGKAGMEEVEEVMVAAVPANPLAGQVIAVADGAYHPGDLRWLRKPVVRFHQPPLPLPSGDDPRIASALEDAGVQSYLVWSRFPVFEIRPIIWIPGESTGDVPMERMQDGWEVRVRDARYVGRGGDALSGPTVLVPGRRPDEDPTPTPAH